MKSTPKIWYNIKNAILKNAEGSMVRLIEAPTLDDALAFLGKDAAEK